MPQYDGSIRIDTLLDTSAIDKGIDSIEDKIKSFGVSLGAVFGAKELISFGKQAIDAASDLTEAQNVVDTAFGSMSYKMEQFASTALETYGISELTAKTMGSTYMAMAKGMGVAEGAASDMAVTLTGRLSDVMSFYNKTQSEVDTIGRAIITGETEPLKAIGVVMTQTNLEAYAMAKGLSKTYSEMSAQEQLLVRYKYFLEQTAMAQGDFAKTSDAWANQTRLLAERTNQFMTNIGNVLIETLTPALQFANEAVSFIDELLFGGRSAEESSAAQSAAETADEVTAVGTAAEKSQKKLNGLISGFDELHIISGAKSSNDENTAEVDATGLLGESLALDATAARKSANKYKDIINEIYLAFRRHPLTKLISGLVDDIADFFSSINGADIDAGGIVTVLMDILTAFLAYKAVSGIVSSTDLFVGNLGKLIKLAAAHPMLAAVAGIVALVAAMDALDAVIRHQILVDSFGDISISLAEIDELTAPISGDIEKIAKSFADNNAKVKSARDNFSSLSTAITNTAEALKKSCDAKDAEEFAMQLDEAFDAALSYTDAVTDTSAMRELFMSDGVIDEEEQNLLSTFDNLGGTLKDKIETISEQIRSITQTAAEENRGLVESEIKNIQRLYSELQEMTAKQTNIESKATWERLVNRDYTYDSYEVLFEEIKKARKETQDMLDELEQASYEDLMSKVSLMESSGASKESIEAIKQSGIASIKESLESKRLESLGYEKRLLQSYYKGRYSKWEDDYFNDTARGIVGYYNVDDSDENLKRIREYYNLIKLETNPTALSNLAEQLGEIDLLSVADSMTGEMQEVIAGIDKGYNDFLSEYNAINGECTDKTEIEADAFQQNLAAIFSGSEDFDITFGEDFLATMTTQAGDIENGGDLLYEAAERAVEQVQNAQQLLAYYGDNESTAAYWKNLINGDSSPYYGADPNMAAYWANLKKYGSLNGTDFSGSSYVNGYPYKPETTESTLTVDVIVNGEKETTEVFRSEYGKSVSRTIITNGKGE